MEKKTFLGTVSGILKVLRLYLAGIIAVGLMYFTLMGVDQGIDIVIQAGEYPWAGVLAVITVALWSYLIWYSCRLLSYTKQTKDDKISTFLLQLIPRLLAFNCFVCVQVAIFNLPNYQFPSWLIYAIFFGQNIYYYLLHQWFTNKRTWARMLGWLCIVGMLALYGYIAWRNQDDSFTYRRHRFWLPLIGAVIFISQTAIVWYFVKRRMKIDARKEQGDLRDTRLSGFFNPAYAPYERGQLRIFTGISLLALLFYGAAIFSILVSDYMGPLPFLMLAFGVLVGFSNLISFFSIRIQINLFLFIFILAIIMGKFTDPYIVRRVEPTGKDFYASRPSVKTYLYRWVKKREKLLDEYIAAGKKFPVYIVCSDGGASRAGNWVCSVLSSLQDSSVARDPHDAFSDHLLAISGASGGSVGNATFYSMLRARELGLLHDSFSKHAATFFDGDFLTFTLARLCGPDFFRHIFPMHRLLGIDVMDRGAALETVLATDSHDPIIDTQMNRPLSRVFDTCGELPIFFITTTRVRDGMPSILCPTKPPVNSQRKDVTDLFEGKDIRLATAAILSSRFPYVSPAGNIHENYFVDGGYVDNAGSGIMLDLLEDLTAIGRDTTDKTSDTARIFNKYRGNATFHVIHIYNSPEPDLISGRINPLANDMVTPLLTLAGMQGSSTLLYTGSLKQYFRNFNRDTSNAIIDYSLYQPGQKVEDYPMSWVISTYQLERMHQRLIEVNKVNIPLYRLLGK